MQADRGDHRPPAPPPRPSLEFAAMPSELAARPRPRVVDVSYWLWLGACLVGVVTAAATLRYFDELQAALLSMVEQQFPGETPATRDDVAWATLAIMIGAGVALILVQLALATAMRAGRSWTRFVLVGCTLLAASYTATVFSNAPILTKAGLLTSTTLALLATIPMFVPPARPWFDPHPLRRS